MALAIKTGHGHCMFEILTHSGDACHLHVKKCVKSYLTPEDRFIEDESWSLTPSVNIDNRSEYEKEFRQLIETSFMLSLKENRYRALDYIFSNHLRDCMAELATVIKTDASLNRKWNIYLGLDLYMPSILVYLILRERARTDIKKRLITSKEVNGLASLPFYQFKEILKYI